MRKSQGLVVFILLIGHGVCWYTQQELWPLSPYPMYSSVFEPESCDFYSLYGIDADGLEIKIPVNKHLFPFWESSFNYAWSQRKGREARDFFLKSMLALYHKRRDHRFPNWPDIRAFRLYRLSHSWQGLREKVKEGLPIHDMAPLERTVMAEVHLQ